jgi:catechol 2,3-dioxygenase-like lactoylglutathione lyase family enzyme
MTKLDHPTLAVRDFTRSRGWYVEHLGFAVEFEIPDARVAALRDDAGFALFVAETGMPAASGSCVLAIQVDDVDALHRVLAAGGVPFVHPPSRQFRGYGAELRDPDGYPVRPWDEASMREKGNA